MKKTEVSFEQVIERGCGIDVHKKIIVASIKGIGLKEETRSFDSFTESIESLKEWLLENDVTHVAMESTGVYWKPIFNILEKDFEIILVNARHIKNVPGHKTDKMDSKWIAKLLLSGLLKGSFIPPKPIRELRDLTRYRRKVVVQLASEKNRLQKILEDANIKLSSVMNSTTGVTAMRIIDEMLSGQEDINELVKLRNGNMKASKEELAASLRGYLTEHHKFMLRVIKESMAEKERIIEILNDQIEVHIKANELELDLELLQTIPGVGKDGASIILSEIGSDMSHFPNEKHLSSWAGMNPGNNESAGKKKVQKQQMGINT